MQTQDTIEARRTQIMTINCAAPTECWLFLLATAYHKTPKSHTSYIPSRFQSLLPSSPLNCPLNLAEAMIIVSSLFEYGIKTLGGPQGARSRPNNIENGEEPRSAYELMMPTTLGRLLSLPQV